MPAGAVTEPKSVLIDGLMVSSPQPDTEEGADPAQPATAMLGSAPSPTAVAASGASPGTVPGTASGADQAARRHAAHRRSGGGAPDSSVASLHSERNPQQLIAPALSSGSGTAGMPERGGSASTTRGDTRKNGQTPSRRDRRCPSVLKSRTWQAAVWAVDESALDHADHTLLPSACRSGWQAIRL